MKRKMKSIDDSTDMGISHSYLVFKRIIDLIIGIIGCIVAFPIILITCILVRLESKGNPIYYKKRVGLNNKEFNINKIGRWCQMLK